LKEAETNIQRIKEIQEANKAILTHQNDVAGALGKNNDFVGLVRTRLDANNVGRYCCVEKECPAGWLSFDAAWWASFSRAGQTQEH